MTNAFQAVKLTERVYWVGALDWQIRNFHGYLTDRGTSYNAFLVLGEQITLIDTVKAPFFDEMLARISSVIEPKKIDNIICNHAEMDHSGNLPRISHLVAPKRIIASKMGAAALEQHFHWDREVEVAKENQPLHLGDQTFSFMETRMLHWPDSMCSYLHGDGVLFSNDAFGMHLASCKLFADEIDPSILRYQAAKYFANILLPFCALVTKVIDRLSGLNLDLKLLAPDHGPLWRKNPEQIIGWYAHWAKQTPTDKAVVIYDTMWESTARMARAIGDGLTQADATTEIMPLAVCHRSDVITQLLESGALLAGAPTMNNNLYPTLADVMTYIKGLKPKNLVGAAFGSYGWSGEAVGQLNQLFQDMKIPLAAEGLKVRYVPDEQTLAQCYAFGQKVASKLKEKLT